MQFLLALIFLLVQISNVNCRVFVENQPHQHHEHPLNCRSHYHGHNVNMLDTAADDNNRLERSMLDHEENEVKNVMPHFYPVDQAYGGNVYIYNILSPHRPQYQYQREEYGQYPSYRPHGQYQYNSVDEKQQNVSIAQIYQHDQRERQQMDDDVVKKQNGTQIQLVTFQYQQSPQPPVQYQYQPAPYQKQPTRQQYQQSQEQYQQSPQPPVQYQQPIQHQFQPIQQQYQQSQEQYQQSQPQYQQIQEQYEPIQQQYQQGQQQYQQGQQQYQQDQQQYQQPPVKARDVLVNSLLFPAKTTRSTTSTTTSTVIEQTALACYSKYSCPDYKSSHCENRKCVCSGKEYQKFSCLPKVGKCYVVRGDPNAVGVPKGASSVDVYSCRPKASSQTSVVHVLSVYKHLNKDSDEMPVYVKAKASLENPLVLVLVSRRAVTWKLHLPDTIVPTAVLQFSFRGSHSDVTAVNESGDPVELEITKFSVPYGYGNDNGGGNTVELLEEVGDIFGPITSFTGTFSASQWELTL